MSDTSGPWPPPPGASPAGGPGGADPWAAPGSASAPQDPWQVPGGVPPWQAQVAAPALRPGAIPLRPLGLGDILDATFRIIRRNAGATVGAAVLVALASMIVPLVVAIVLTSSSTDLSWLDTSSDSSSFSTSTGSGLAALVVSFVFSGLVQFVGLMLVSAMAVPVTLAAAAGRTMTMREAWRATHGRRWRVLGVVALFALVVTLLAMLYVVPFIIIASNGADTVSLVVWGVVATPLFVVAMVWGWTRLYVLLVPAVVGERLGVFRGVGRAYTLSRRQFWRIFGIAVLTAIMVGIAAQVISIPISLVSNLLPIVIGPRWLGLSLVLGRTLSGVVTAAFTTPVVSVVSALLYVDQRIRKEAYDVELMEQAGLTR
jgi:hypothetical protein